jgi:drug/metabolite transporter (DMT)-like permease
VGFFVFVQTTADSRPISTFLICAGSSICFCTKGIFAKLAYVQGADTITVLALRMGMALPVFLVVGWWSNRGKTADSVPGDWWKLICLGFLGYYLSSFVNFHGLRLVSVGLERMVLYTYPCLVLLGSALVLRRPVRLGMWLWMGVAYLGIVFTFFGEVGQPGSQLHNILLGGGLVFLSALTYAWFILSSGEILRRVGPAVFTSRVVTASCVMILLHFAATRPLSSLANLTGKTYAYGAALALVGTVIPSYLLGIGLKRAGAQRFAVIGTVGPIVSILLAATLLGEAPGWWQVVGFLLSLVGGLGVSLLKSAAQGEAETPTK